MGTWNRIFVMPVIFLLVLLLATNLFSEQIDTGSPSLKTPNPQLKKAYSQEESIVQISPLSISTSTNEPITLASELSGPNLLTVDQDNVYWTENKYSANSWIVSVKKVSLSGGTVNTIAGSGGEGGTGIVVDNNSVYWGVNPGYGNGNIYKMPKSGGTITELAEANQPYDIDVDSTYVYWAENNSGGADGVRKVSINGGSVTSLTTSGTMHGIMAIDDSYVYFRYHNGSNAYKIAKISKNGGSIINLVSLLSDETSVSVEKFNKAKIPVYSGIL